MGFAVMGLEFVFEQAFKLVRIEIAADDEPQADGDEDEHEVVGKYVRVLLQERAFLRVREIVLDGHDAVFTHLDQNVEQQIQKSDVIVARVAGAP
jgi:hypothetical protein